MLSEKIKEHMVKYTAIERVYRRINRKGKGINLSLQKKKKERKRNEKAKSQNGGARQTLMHVHAGCVPFISAAPTAPTPHSALCRAGTW